METLWLDQIIYENGLLYGIDVEEQVIYAIDPMKSVATKIVAVPTTNASSFRENVSCVKRANNLYLFPDKGNAIWKYNMIDNTFCKIHELPNKNLRKTIRTVFMVENIIYAISGMEKAIFEIDNEDGIVRRPYNDFVRFCTEIGSGSCEHNKKIYFTAPEDNLIVIFDTEKKEFRSKKINESFSPQTVSFIDGSVYLTGRKNYLMVLDSNLGVKERIMIHDGVSIFKYDDKEYKIDKVTESDRPFFRNSVYVNGKLLLVPYISTDLMAYDLKDHKIETICVGYTNLTRNGIHDKEGITYRISHVVDNKFVWLYRFADDTIIKYYWEDGKVELSHISKELSKEYLKSLRNRGIITEGMICLSEYISEVIGQNV